jgi:two-component system sensor histidine kinase/response regulator
MALKRPLPHMVMVTAYGREEVLKEAALAGLEDVLIKPVSASTMFDTLVQVLGGKRDEKRDEDQQAMSAIENLSAIKGSSILLVEDNEFNQQIAVELLSDAGFAVDVAENGRKSIEMLDKRTYDIVLMDMQMPVMDGTTATREIRKDERFKDLPILAMTANVMEADIEKCREAGMWDHIGKPIDPDELFGKLLKWVKPKPRRIEEVQETAAVPATAVEEKKPEEAKIAEQDGLPHIPGLDITQGLKRVLGKKDFYLKILGMFITNQGEAPAQIRQSLDSGDHETAERLAHSAKGVSGNVGATGLQEMAAKVEKAIKEGQPREDIEKVLVPFAEAHAILITRLKEALPAQEIREVAGPEITPVNREKAVAACKRLTELLTNDDSEAVDFLDGESDVLRGMLGTKQFAFIEEAIKQYDFEKALGLLKKQLDDLDIEV